MKIFRAVFEFNNNDSCEWEEWYTRTSNWYFNKSLAEQHIATLEQFRDFLRDHYKDSECFECKEPYIEEQEVEEEFVPMQLEFEGEEFRGFKYTPYDGPYTVSPKELSFSGLPNPSWYINVSIGNEDFTIIFSSYSDEFDTFLHYKTAQENSNFYKYPTETREKLLSLVKEYAESIVPYFKKYREESEELGYWDMYEIEDPRRNAGWEAQRVSEINNIENLLKNIPLQLSKCTLFIIEDEIRRMKDRYPKYKEALAKLLPYCVDCEEDVN